MVIFFYAKARDLVIKVGMHMDPKILDPGYNIQVFNIQYFLTPSILLLLYFFPTLHLSLPIYFFPYFLLSFLLLYLFP